MVASADDISERIVQAVLTRRLLPAERLGEAPLAELFGCSRTIVREALIRLAARGIVAVQARRGWFVAAPDARAVAAAFEARLILETGILGRVPPPGPAPLRRLAAHLRAQRAALAQDDPGQRSLLLGDFHVVLARELGMPLLADMLRDLTIRTSLAALRHQPLAAAARSVAEHEGIVAALRLGDMPAAQAAMAAHLGSWEAKLPLPDAADPPDRLRRALDPTAPAS